MDTMNIIQNILQENLDIDPSDVTLESTFESLNVDSLDMVELVCAIEDECDIDFGEPEGIETVGELIEYIEGLQA